MGRPKSLEKPKRFEIKLDARSQQRLASIRARLEAPSEASVIRFALSELDKAVSSGKYDDKVVLL